MPYIFFIFLTSESCCVFVMDSTELNVWFQDKSSNVRKAAVQLLTTLLESNPFAAKLGTMDLEIKLKEEELKLKEMTPDDQEEVDPVQEWNNIKEAVSDGVKSAIDEQEGEPEKCWEGASQGALHSTVLLVTLDKNKETRKE